MFAKVTVCALGAAAMFWLTACGGGQHDVQEVPAQSAALAPAAAVPPAQEADAAAIAYEQSFSMEMNRRHAEQVAEAAAADAAAGRVVPLCRTQGGSACAGTPDF